MCLLFVWGRHTKQVNMKLCFHTSLKNIENPFSFYLCTACKVSLITIRIFCRPHFFHEMAAKGLSHDSLLFWLFDLLLCIPMRQRAFCHKKNKIKWIWKVHRQVPALFTLCPFAWLRETLSCLYPQVSSFTNLHWDVFNDFSLFGFNEFLTLLFSVQYIIGVSSERSEIYVFFPLWCHHS